MKFTHIYIEKGIFSHPRTQAVMGRFPDSHVILIDHYKDVFNRRGQDPVLQHAHQNLILAAAKERNVYPGAPVCQDFGNAHFYYTSCAMNCLYDCEYCYLKGMYPSGNLVIFVDLERIMQEVEILLAEFPVYLCVSYDTDLLAMEDILHYAAAWIEFTQHHKNLSIEIRTKCARQDIYGKHVNVSSSSCIPFSGISSSRVIFAYTISPDSIISCYEHGTPSLQARLQAAALGLQQGYSIRLCFDPMIYVPDWRELYHDMLQQTAASLPLDKVKDFSIGSFRISETYLKNLRRMEPYSAVVQYPFVLEQGYYHYPDSVVKEMEGALEKELRSLVPSASIFRWK